MSDGSADLTDEALLVSMTNVNVRLRDAAIGQLAALGDVHDDPRWAGYPIPLSFESQIVALFLGAIDAQDVTVGALAIRPSQQAFAGLRFLAETDVLVRWLFEPTEPHARQERAYQLTGAQIGRVEKFTAEDAGDDPEALEVVDAIRDSATLLREIAREDGIEHLAGPLGRRDRHERYGQKSAFPSFSMLSEFGSHPPALGNLLFSVDPTSHRINYDMQGKFLARALWSGSAMIHFWRTCQAVAGGFGWDEWLSGTAEPIHASATPLLEVTLQRWSERKVAPGDPDS